MRLKKRVLAGILTLVMFASSLQLSTETVRATEISGEPLAVTDVTEAADAGREDTSESEEKEKSDSEKEKSDLEDEGSDSKEKESETGDKAPDESEDLEETKDSNQTETDDEQPPETDDSDTEEDNELEESDEEEENQILESMDDPASDSQLVIVEAELEGVYQFGDAPAPSKDGGVSAYSVHASSYTYTDSEAETYLYQQMKERIETIDIQKYNIEIDAVGSFVSGVLNEHPDLYFVNKRYEYSYSGTRVNKLIFTYDNTLDDAAFRREVASAMAVVDAGMSDLEKAIALHDYLAVNCEYDYENYLKGNIPSTSHSAYGVFVERTAVCEGYALAYKYLLNQQGIDCYMVTSKKINHAWNLIVLDEEYYQVDVTWDDPIWDLIGRACHTYMFCSDSSFRASHSNGKNAANYDGIVTSGSNEVDYKAASTKYDNAFWKNCNSPLVLEGDSCYYVSYISSDGCAVRKTDLSDITAAGTPICRIDNIWYVWGENSYWTAAFSGLFRIGSRLYYNDSTCIYSIDLDGKNKSTVFTADTTEGYIYGSAYCQEKVLYSLHKDPNLEERENVLVADISVSAPHITVTKTKTSYECGDTIEVNDLTVTYYNEDGVSGVVTDYTTNVAEIDMSTPGKKILIVTYGGMTAKVELTVTYPLKADSVTIMLPDETYRYDAKAKQPIPTVTVGTTTFITLTAGQDYTVSYEDNINAGMEAKVIITGQGDYSGTLTETFTIEKAPLKITACDTILAVGDALPASNEYEYQITGLYGKDKLIQEPTFTCSAADSTALGIYTITPSGADAGTNYEITYYDGELTIAEERVAYKVIFDLAGRGMDIAPLIGIKAGSVIDAPTEPEAAGYLFKGWYKDKSYTKAWDFSTDTVQSDITLYARWLVLASETDKEGMALNIQEIQSQFYTGSALKPSVVVYSGDGDTLLKAGKDYTIQYKNNIEADKLEEKALGGTSMTGKDDKNGSGFTTDLAYVVITGKGNYTGTVYRNFHIDAALISDGAGNPASGFTMKYTEQMVSGKNALKPFTSIKYKKSMKAGTDYEVKLTALQAYDTEEKELNAGQLIAESGGENKIPTIPAGYGGTYRLTVTGKNNYEGEITRTIYVADQKHLMKNATITLGKNLKSIEYIGKSVTLTPAYYDADVKKYYAIDSDGVENRAEELDVKDVFTVKFGKEYLRYGKDFSIGYTNNKSVGIATLTITGTGDYTGSKSVTFKIVGTAFNTKNVIVANDDGSGALGGLKPSVPYTGKAITQNGVVLKAVNGMKANEQLIYGKDYTISYKNNLKKGTATMTFLAKPASGYSGSFKKTFKITAAALNNEAAVRAVVMNNLLEDGVLPDRVEQKNDGSVSFAGEVPYSREGAKLTGRIQLINQITGAVLKEGTDYTVSYANNKTVTDNSTVADDSPNKLPTMTLKGKGNYEGMLAVTFRITEAALSGNANLTVTAAATAYDERNGNKEDFVYQPRIKVQDGKKTLSDKKDYEVHYVNCTQEQVNSYLQALEQLAAKSTIAKEDLEALADKRPHAVLTAREGSGYKAGNSITVDLNIYRTKLTGNNLYIVISEDTAQTTYIDTDTNKQVTPEAAVYYGDAQAVRAAKNAKETREAELTNKNGSYALTRLTEQKPEVDGIGNYTLTYGANVTAGKNKGSVTVIGTGLYGGSVTTKFTINSKNIYNTIK